MADSKIETNRYGIEDSTDISARVKTLFSAIDYGTDGAIIYTKDRSGKHIIDFQFKTTGAISSGSGSLSSYVDEYPKTQKHCALVTNDGKTGWVQFTGTGNIYIRCQASSGSYFCGQLVY